MALFTLSKKDNAAASHAAQTQGGAQYPSPFLPSVSLVPRSRLSVLERRRASRRVAVIATFVVGGALVIGGVLGVGLLAARSAEAAAKAERDQARLEAEQLAPVRDLYEGFETRQRAVADALASDVDYYSLIMSLQEAVQAEIPREALMQDQSGTWYVKSDYSHIGLVNYSVQNTPCPGNEPFTPEPALGCISGTAVSSSYIAAGEAIATLNNDPDNGLFGGYILNATNSDPVGRVGQTTWSFTINFGVSALSGKYADEARTILGVEPEAPAGPAPSPSANAGGN